jgi:MFS transporter, ACS family, glucarate transporter
LNSLAQFAANFGWVLLLTLLPKYLDEIYKVPLEQRGWMQGMPLLVGIFGMLCGGVLTDWCAKKFGLRWGRTIPLIASRIAVSMAFLMLIFAGADSLALVLVAFALVSFFTDIGTPATWALGQDVGGRHTGAVVGWANMWGNFGAALMPLVFARILEQYPKDRQLDGWIAAFWLCFGLQVIVAFCISGIDAREKLEP